MNQAHELVENFHRPKSGIDIPMLRHELESAAALTMTDLTYELCCQLEEVPGLQFWHRSELPTDWQIARLMATCFEAGRRYGLLSAIEILDEDIRIDRDDPDYSLRIKYGHLSTIEEAEAINDVTRIFAGGLEQYARDYPCAFADHTRTAQRLLRLQKEQPKLYDLLRDVIVKACAQTTPAPSAPRRPRCQTEAPRTSPRGPERQPKP